MIKLIKTTIMLASAALAACATGPKFRSVTRGMTMEQVKQVVGEPDESLTIKGYQAYKWTDRLVSGWGWDKADYFVVMDKDTNTVRGQGRQNYRSAPRPVYVPVVYQPEPTPVKLNCTSTTMGGTVYTDCN